MTIAIIAKSQFDGKQRKLPKKDDNNELILVKVLPCVENLTRASVTPSKPAKRRTVVRESALNRLLTDGRKDIKTGVTGILFYFSAS